MAKIPKKFNYYKARVKKVGKFKVNYSPRVDVSIGKSFVDVSVSKLATPPLGYSGSPIFDPVQSLHNLDLKEGARKFFKLKNKKAIEKWVKGPNK